MQDITNLSMKTLKEGLERFEMAPFAVNQILLWLYEKKADSFKEMSNLSKQNRARLEEEFFIERLALDQVQDSSDGTRKYLFKLKDGKKIEAVYIPSPKRKTLCLSTQVGCAMACDFCRTGEMGLTRNLTQSEIINQVIAVEKDCKAEPLTNLVFMGMGEPMANLKALLPSLELLHSHNAFKLPKRRITVSTSALVPKMYEFIKESDVKLAISLHAANDELRSKLVPINKRYNLSQLHKFCLDYQKIYSHRLTFEYVMLKGINDTKESLKELMKYLGDVRAKINLIPFNPYPGSPYKSSTKQTLDFWTEKLYKAGIQTNVRVQRGQDILAACGQLAA